MTNQVKLNGSLLGDSATHIFLEAAPEANRNHRIDTRTRRRGPSRSQWAGRDLPSIGLRFIVRGSDAKVNEWIRHIHDEVDRSDGESVTVEHLLAPLWMDEKRIALLVTGSPASWVDGEGGRRWGVVEVSAVIRGVWSVDAGDFVEIRSGSFKGKQAELDSDDFEAESLAAAPPSAWTKEHGTGTGFTWTVRDDADGSRAVRVDDSAAVGPAHNTLRPTTGGTGLSDVDVLAKIKATDGLSAWESQSAAEANQWRDIAWSPSRGLYAAVSDTGTNRVMTSPDGVTWTARSAANQNTWQGIAWSPALSLFVAVAFSTSSDQVMTSPDGVTWTAQTSPTGNWRSVTWVAHLDLFVAVGSGGAIMTSPDGETWTTPDQNIASGLFKVTVSPELGLIVAVGGGGKIATSTDGNSWIDRTTSVVTTWRDIAWSPELGIFVIVNASGEVATSIDGSTWTLQTPAESNDWVGVEWSSDLGIFVAVARSGTNRVMVSSDGKTWTSQVQAESNQWEAIVYAPALAQFAAVADSGTNRVMTNTSPPHNWGVTARGAIASPNHTGYALAFKVFGSGRLALLDLSGVDTQTALDSGDPVATKIGEYYWLRFRVVGTTLKGKIWRDGGQEPLAGGPDDDGFQLKVIDATHAAGFVGFYHREGAPSEAHYYDDWSRLDPDVTLEREDGVDTGATALIVLPEQEAGHPLAVNRATLVEEAVSGPASTSSENLKDGSTRTLETYDITDYLHPLPTLRDQKGRYRIKQSPNGDYLDGTT